MVCDKCGKNIEQDGARFCPHCGKRIERQVVPSMTNAEYLKVITFEEFSDIWNELKQKDARVAFEWLDLERPSRLVFGIKAKYSWADRAHKLSRKQGRLVSATELAVLLADKKWVVGKVVPHKYALTKLHSRGDFGELVFETEEECAAAIQKVMDNLRGKQA